MTKEQAMDLAVAIENLIASRLYRYHVFNGHMVHMAARIDPDVEVLTMRKKLAALLEAA